MPRRTLRALLLLRPKHWRRRLFHARVTADGNYANCQCFDIPYGVYFVDINAILNHDVYEKTVAQCGADGSLCATLNSAPVCANVNQGNLIPGSTVYSTFSFDCVPENGLGLTDCAQQPYAGCMTAPCFKTSQAGIVNCSCPTFNGPYQVGQNDQACTLGDNLVWSAAYAPPAATPTATPVPPSLSASTNYAVPAAVPSPPACLPDAPGGLGCPLYDPGVHDDSAGFGEARILELNSQCRPTLPDHRPALVWDGAQTLRVNGLYRHGYMIVPEVADEAARFAAALLKGAHRRRRCLCRLAARCPLERAVSACPARPAGLLAGAGMSVAAIYAALAGPVISAID